MKNSFLFLILPAIGSTTAFSGHREGIIQTRDATLSRVTRDGGYATNTIRRRDDESTLRRRGSCFSRKCAAEPRSQSRPPVPSVPRLPTQFNQDGKENARNQRLQSSDKVSQHTPLPSRPKPPASSMAPSKFAQSSKVSGFSRPDRLDKLDRSDRSDQPDSSGRKSTLSLPLHSKSLSRMSSYESHDQDPKQKVNDWLARAG